MQDQDLLRETYRLAQENNKLLHKMRRSAFWGRIVTFIIYAALLIAPLWFYLQYMAPVVNQMLHAVQQVQGAGAQAQAEFTSFQEMWKQFQERFGSTSQ